MSEPGHLTPAEARVRGRGARRTMSSDARTVASAEISRRLGRLPVISRARTVAGYWPTSEEVDLTVLWERLHSDGVVVCLPRIVPSTAVGPSLEFVPWDPTVSMTTNRFGIPEPTGGPTGIGDIDVVVLPCTAVDDSGTRVGMGAGFYDRTLGAAKGSGTPMLICVAFESQRVPPPGAIRRQPWDVPCGLVITEASSIDTGDAHPERITRDS